MRERQISLKGKNLPSEEEVKDIVNSVYKNVKSIEVYVDKEKNLCDIYVRQDEDDISIEVGYGHVQFASALSEYADYEEITSIEEWENSI